MVRSRFLGNHNRSTDGLPGIGVAVGAFLTVVRLLPRRVLGDALLRDLAHLLKLVLGWIEWPLWRCHGRGETHWSDHVFPLLVHGEELPRGLSLLRALPLLPELLRFDLSLQLCFVFSLLPLLLGLLACVPSREVRGKTASRGSCQRRRGGSGKGRVATPRSLAPRGTKTASSRDFVIPLISLALLVCPKESILALRF